MSGTGTMRAADALLAAFATGEALAALPGEPLATREAAYAVQDDMVRRLGGAAGWKVSPLREGAPMCSPIPAILLQAGPAMPDAARRRDTIVEGEIAVRFGRGLPPRAEPYRADEVAEAIASLHPAIEVVTSRYRDRAAQPPLHALADLQNCGGVVLGPAVADWRGLETGTLAGRLAIDGVAVAERGEQPRTARMLAALAWLAGHAAGRGWPIAEGHVVITGARLGPALARPGATVVAGFDGLGEAVMADAD